MLLAGMALLTVGSVPIFLAISTGSFVPALVAALGLLSVPCLFYCLHRYSSSEQQPATTDHDTTS